MTAGRVRSLLAGQVGRASTRPLRVALLGGFGVGNVGNDASLDAVIRLVRRADPDAHLTCVCPNPEVVSRRFNIPARTVRCARPVGRVHASPIGRVIRLPYRIGDVWRALRVMGSHDVLVVPGTGILDDYGGEGPTGWPLTLATWLAAARLRGARTGLVGVGAGPLMHPVSRRLAYMVGRLADYGSFRDSGSRDFMLSTGLDVRPDEIIPDIVFSKPPPEPTAPSSVRPLVVVPVMKYLGWYSKQRSAVIGDRYTGTLAEFCAWLLDEGFAVRLVTADAGDHPATQRVADLVVAAAPELSRRWLTVAVADDLEDLIQLVSDSTAVVATRYHSVISALICGKPTISLGYAAKNTELMGAVGLAAYCQHAEQIDQCMLRRQFRELMASYDHLAGEVASRVAEFGERLAAEEKQLKTRLWPEVAGP